MSQNSKKARLMESKDSDSNLSNAESQESNSSGNSQETPRRKFNFWKSKTHQQDNSASLANLNSTKDCDLKTLTPGRKMIEICFRVAHLSMSETKYGHRVCVLVYDTSGEAELFAFRETAEKFYAIFKVDQTFKIKDYVVKDAESRNFTNCVVVELLPGTEVTEQTALNIPKLAFKFLGIDSIFQLYEQNEKNAKADFLGVAVRIGSLGYTKSGKGMRTIDLTDQSKGNMQLKLWGKEAEAFSANEFDILAIRQAAIKKYGDEVYLNFQIGCAILINPENPEAIELKEWFKNAMDDPMEVCSDSEMME